MRFGLIIRRVVADFFPELRDNVEYIRSFQLTT